jgi:hypothetical protein
MRHARSKPTRNAGIINDCVTKATETQPTCNITPRLLYDKAVAYAPGRVNKLIHALLQRIRGHSYFGIEHIQLSKPQLPFIPFDPIPVNVSGHNFERIVVAWQRRSDSCR